MTKEELREHCKKQVKACEMWAENRGQEPSGKVYEEHKLILELLEENEDFQNYINKANHTNSQLIQLIEKHKMNRDTCDDCVSIAELEKWLDLNFSFGGACRKLELFERLEKELPRVTPTFPKGATNGDMIKAMFPNGEYGTNGNFVHVYISYFAIIQTMTFDLSWWNAPYKRGFEKTYELVGESKETE